MPSANSAVITFLLVVTAFFVAPPAVRAQAVYVDHLLTRDVSGINSSPDGVNGSRWITRGDPNAAVLNANTIQWLFNDHPIIWRDEAKYAQFQYDEFISIDSTRRNLYLSTFSGSSTRLGIQHATFTSVTFKPQTVTLTTLGTYENTDKNISWTLENSRIEGDVTTPVFDGGSHFTSAAPSPDPASSKWTDCSNLRRARASSPWPAISGFSRAARHSWWSIRRHSRPSISPCRA